MSKEIHCSKFSYQLWNECLLPLCILTSDDYADHSIPEHSESKSLVENAEQSGRHM